MEELNKLQPEIIKNNLVRYPIFIYKLIQVKGYNEFLTKDIIDLAIIKRKNKGRYTSYLIREILIPNGIIKELKKPEFTKNVIPATKVYELTGKAIEIAKNIINKQ